MNWQNYWVSVLPAEKKLPKYKICDDKPIPTLTPCNSNHQKIQKKSKGQKITAMLVERRINPELTKGLFDMLVDRFWHHSP